MAQVDDKTLVGVDFQCLCHVGQAFELACIEQHEVGVGRLFVTQLEQMHHAEAVRPRITDGLCIGRCAHETTHDEEF